jgi:isoquinoline 1-oxidoreductase
MMDSTTADSSPSFRPDQDDLQSRPMAKFQLNRRKFFKIFGSGLAVAFVSRDIFSFAEESVPPGSSLIPTDQVGAWIHIGEDGVVSVYTGKVEVGQNIRTSLSQIVAEELYVPLTSIKMIMGILTLFLMMQVRLEAGPLLKWEHNCAKLLQLRDRHY